MGSPNQSAVLMTVELEGFIAGLYEEKMNGDRDGMKGDPETRRRAVRDRLCGGGVCGLARKRRRRRRRSVGIVLGPRPRQGSLHSHTRTHTHAPRVIGRAALLRFPPLQKPLIVMHRQPFQPNVTRRITQPPRVSVTSRAIRVAHLLERLF